MKKEKEFTFIARLECGCVAIAISDIPELSKEIADMYRLRENNNITIDRVTKEQAMKILPDDRRYFCKFHLKEKKNERAI